MRRTKQESEQTRQAISHSALLIFAARGYAATRLDDVAQDAQVTRGAVYFHFKDKAALYRAAMEGPAAKLRETMGAALTGPQSAKLRLERWFHAVLQLVEDNTEVRSALEVQWLRTEALAEFADDLEKKRQGTKMLLSSLASLLEEAHTQGEVIKLDFLAAAQGLLSLLMGLLHGWIFDPSTPLVPQGRVAAQIYFQGLASV